MSKKEKKTEKTVQILDALGIDSTEGGEASVKILKSDGQPPGTVINITKNKDFTINFTIEGDCTCRDDEDDLFDVCDCGDGEDCTCDDFDILESIEDVDSALEELGYETIKHSDSIHVAMGSSDHPFVSVMVRNFQGDLVITCQVAKMGDLDEDKIPEVQLMLLDANTRIRPYAFGIITSSDNPELDDAADFPIVLTDSIPMIDLCKEELESSMDSLLAALQTSSEALRVGINK